MSRLFKLGVTGTHSTGKSTFIDELDRRLRGVGIGTSRVADLATEARDRGFPILREHTFESTAWIISRGMTLELEAAQGAAVVLVDRPVSDALGYLRAALRYRKEELRGDEARYLRELVSLHSRSYDRILLTEIDGSLPIDRSKERDYDNEFRLMAATAVKEVLEDLSIPFGPLTVANREVVTSLLVAEIRELEGTS